MTNSSPSALISLGQLLSQARQAEGLGLDQLAKRLHMGEEQLRAIEEGNLEKLPEPVFVIAQARRIAQALDLGIDAEIQALRQSELFSQQSISVNELRPTPSPNEHTKASSPREALVSSPSSKTGDGSPGPRLLRALASVVLVAGIAAGAAGLWQQWQWHQQQQRLRQLALARQAELALQAKQRAAELAAQARSATSLTLTSSKGSWLEVKTLDGKRLFRGDFRGKRVFPLAGGLKLLAGRPDLVGLQLGVAPTRPLGPISPVAWQTFAAPLLPAKAPAAKVPAAKVPAATPRATGAPEAPVKAPTP